MIFIPHLFVIVPFLGMILAHSANIHVKSIEVEQEAEQGTFIRGELISFSDIPRNAEGVDNLLELGTEVRYTDIRLSFHAAQEALELAKSIGYLEGEGRAHVLIGDKYLDFGDHENALLHYFFSYRIEESRGNDAGMSDLLNNIALVYGDQKNYSKAAEYLKKSIEIRERLGQNEKTYLSFNNLGVIYRREGRYDDALHYFKKAEYYSLEGSPDSTLHMVATLNIGNTYRNIGSFELAQTYLEKADSYFERMGFLTYQIVSNLFLGQLFQELGENELALHYGKKSLEMAITGDQSERIGDAYEFLAGIYERKQNFEEAYRNLSLFQQVNDYLNVNQHNARVNELQIQFEVEQKDREIALHEARIVQQELVRKFMLSGLAFMVIIVSLLVYTNRQKNKSNRLLYQRGEEIENQNVQLAKLNREKDEFLSMAAHDLRNPLSVIMGTANLLYSDEDLKPEEVEEYGRLIESSSERMLKLINSMLEIKVINAENIQETLTKVDVNNVLLQSIHHFQPSADSKNIQLRTELDSEAGLIEGDTGSLSRIFDNLISNAIKYSPEGSQVLITTTELDGRVRIAVKDEGPGLSEEDHRQLFGRYARLSTQPTGNETSTGLGLYIVKKITASLNGKVWCDSEPGKGAVFYVEFAKCQIKQ